MDNQLDFYLQRMKQQCAIRDAKYWDVKLEEGEILTTCNEKFFSIRTKDGFKIRIEFMNRGFGPVFFNGYVSLPSTPNLYHLTNWACDNPSYDYMNYEVDLNVEFTYCDETMLEYGWDHAHCWDADFGRPLSSQEEQHPSGPVQVLEEARGVITGMKVKEKRLILQKIDEKLEIMDTIREELMMETCHPRRVAAWAAAGYDPFA